MATVDGATFWKAEAGRLVAENRALAERLRERETLNTAVLLEIELRARELIDRAWMGAPRELREIRLLACDALCGEAATALRALAPRAADAGNAAPDAHSGPSGRPDG